MSAPQEKPVVLAVKTVSSLAASSASVSKPKTVVKKTTTVVKKVSGAPVKTIVKKVVAPGTSSAVVKKVVAPGTSSAVVKRKVDSTGKTITVVKKVAASGVAAPKKVVKKIAGDDCEVDEERSDDGSDDGSDLKGFLVDDDDDEDGYSEDEVERVEKESFTSVDDYRREMKGVLALLGSRATRQRYIAENPGALFDDKKK